MKVKIHTLFQYLLDTTEADPEAIVGFSLARSPKLGDFLRDLDPELSLDWNGKSFRGLPALREHVIAQAGLSGICTPDDVLITAGAAEANYLVIRQLVEAGDEIVTEVPGWPQAAVLGAAVGANMRLVHRREEDQWRLPLDQLRDAVTSRTKLIFLSNPNNPTGRLMDEAELAEIVAIARSVGAWLLVDEVYAGLEWEGTRAPSIAGLYERGITTGSVSKALGLQGLRTGWMICRDKDLIMDAVILRENASEIMNIMGEAIAEIALRPERLGPALDRARAEGRANLDQLDWFVANEPKLSWVRPQAGLIGLARLANGIDSDDFARRLLAPPYRTFLLPGSAYDMPGHIRLGVGGGESVRLEDGLSRVSQLLQDWDAPEQRNHKPLREA
ncbi:aminotransferase class I/II-fold pyridoxal phosphate-dependent enzyme [Rhizobium sp. EC-SD404]|uniref:aminotransferase class I/II-fold pyridoxal phosphate-dependent enzyme n=1 Tax=Rhizobium sp. EC-SD404 TaxID=2038389 RepID=UPI00125285A4|nr:aminotransferase class I/II-fold pyridoxal phosphate-dependent enzyme [Rhizobium sp. EC-SD404]VVT31712.1 Aspartate/tyrosine/aromatic aminotransferase [Rhizobium sp. EC-SD404]